MPQGTGVHHSLLYIPMSEPSGTQLPVLVLADGQLARTAAQYARHLQMHGTSPSGLHRHIKAIGLVYDYAVAAGALEQKVRSGWSGRATIARFIELRRFGTEGNASDAVSFLGWRPGQPTEISAEVAKIRRFLKFCQSLDVSVSEQTPLDRFILALASDQDLVDTALDSANRRGLLSHIRPRARLRPTVVSSVPTVRRAVNDGKARHFPANRIVPLLQEAESVRDQILYIFGIFAALRLSEALNLFATDIQIADNDPAIVLAHPELASYKWKDIYGRQRIGTRAEYLTDRFTRIPRSKLPVNHRQYAGWKGIVFHGPHAETDLGPIERYTTTAFWLVQQAAALFWKLHLLYEPLRLSVAGNHPYYFVNLNGPFRGEPLCAKNAQVAFSRAARRAGSTVTNIHSTRHFYGYAAKNLLRKENSEGQLINLSLEEVRAMMRHRNIESTQVYATTDLARIRSELADAGILSSRVDLSAMDGIIDAWLQGVRAR